MDVFERFESNVRSYSRSFPTVFRHSAGALLFDEEEHRYIDFLSGAGALNYGHNHPRLKRAVIDYLEQNGVVLGLDLATTAKRQFIQRFREVILTPRRLTYKFQFTGPTGANGVEAALKIARKAKGRQNVVAFSNSFHGLSAGALSVSANSAYRHDAFVNRTNVSFLPYEGYLDSTDTLSYLRRALADPGSGVDLPAAIIVECVQADGGINVASSSWLQALSTTCREHDVLLIVDDIQAGNGRTGRYFGFERAEIVPDLVVVSKSLSGIGLPMTLLLLKPEFDVWEPGEHTGTFRGNNLAFVSAADALSFWEDPTFEDSIAARGKLVGDTLAHIAEGRPAARYRGLGLIWGLECPAPNIAASIRTEAFRRGLIVELCGPNETTVKIMPPLVIEETLLKEGLAILHAAVNSHWPKLKTPPLYEEL